MTRRGRLAWLAATVTLVSCIEITIDGDALGSLEFVPLAYTSIDAGDELRDTLGRPAPLQGRVFRANGDADTNAIVEFSILTGTGARIAGKRLIADSLRGDTASKTLTLFAATGGLQSQSRTITIVRAPSVFVADGDTLRRITYRVIPLPTDTFPDLKVSLRSSQAQGAGVQGYLTRYTIRRGNTILSTTDTSKSYWLQNESGRVSDLDTTGVQGDASRRLIFRRRSGQPERDTVQVTAEIRPLTPGGPPRRVQWRVVVQPAV